MGRWVISTQRAFFSAKAQLRTNNDLFAPTYLAILQLKNRRLNEMDKSGSDDLD